MNKICTRRRPWAVILALLLFIGDYTIFSLSGAVETAGRRENNFTAALEAYREGSYEAAVEQLESILQKEALKPHSKAKALLLLGVCREKLGETDRASDCFLKLKKMLDEKAVDREPVIPGIEPGSFAAYREVFSEESFFVHKEPLAVSEVIRKNVVHAPRKTAEQKKKEKKKKKFPWLLAIGTAVVAGTAAVLILAAKKGKNKFDMPEIDWVRIPAGEFLMGDGFNEGGADELPQHTVYLDEYYISKYEITYSQYDSFCRDTGRVTPSKNVINRRNRSGDGNFPITEVSWQDARAFCSWLSGETGENIHLPTEAQWEKAARGNRQDRYPWGNSEPNCGIVNYFGCGNSETYYSLLDPVDRYNLGRSPYGLYSMGGNVREWCLDWYSDSYYSVSPTRNPPGPGNGAYRVIRGGSIYTRSDALRSAHRAYETTDALHADLGFRIVKEAGFSPD